MVLRVVAPEKSGVIARTRHLPDEPPDDPACPLARLAHRLARLARCAERAGLDHARELLLAVERALREGRGHEGS